MCYSHMGKPHTTIAANTFHCWVRDGIRWYRIAMVARRKRYTCRRAVSACHALSVALCFTIARVLVCINNVGKADSLISKVSKPWWLALSLRGVCCPIAHSCVSCHTKPFGCCMVKPHGQLVQVSLTPYNASTPCLSTSSSMTTLQRP